MKNINDLKILSYELENEKEFGLNIVIENMRNTTGLPDRWAIKNGAITLNKRTGKFDFEPMPSSRTHAYLQSHRFETASEAVYLYNQLVGKIEDRYSRLADKILWKHLEAGDNPPAIDICRQVMDAGKKTYNHFAMFCVLRLIKKKTILQKSAS